MTFAEKLARLRRREGISQEELAAALGVSRQAISRWELGTALPDAPNLMKLRQRFGVSVDALLDEELGWETLTGDHPDCPAKPRPRRGRYIAGGAALGAGGLGLLLLRLLSSLFPAEVGISEVGADWDRSYTGLAGFLMYHDLEWLFRLCILTAAAGLGILLLSWLSDRRKAHRHTDTKRT